MLNKEIKEPKYSGCFRAGNAAGRLSEQTIQAVRDAATIADVVSRYVDLKANAGLCPFHAERTPSFRIKPSKGYYKCFGCGKSGDSIRFVQEMENLSFADAITTLAGWYNITTERETTPLAFRPRRVKPKAPDPVYIPGEVVGQTQGHFLLNRFYNHLAQNLRFKREDVDRVFADYKVGTAHLLWPFSTTFSYIDHQGNCVAVQLKEFDDNGRTVRGITPDGKKYRRDGWYHYELKRDCERSGNPYPAWLTSFLEYQKQADKLVTCFFGSHLINRDKSKPIAITEAAASCVTMALLVPEYTWVGSYNLTGLTVEKCQVLKGRKVFVFPDASLPKPGSRDTRTAYERWRDTCDEMGSLADFTVSRFLEDVCTDEQKRNGYDVRDLAEQQHLLRLNQAIAA